MRVSISCCMSRSVCMFYVPGIADVAEVVNNNQATGSCRLGLQYGNGGFGGVLGGDTTGNNVGGTLGDQEAHEVFAIAGAGDSCMFVGIEATADQGRVADTPWILIERATG